MGACVAEDDEGSILGGETGKGHITKFGSSR